MLTKKQQAVTSAEATAQDYNQLSKSYRNCAPRSSENFKEQLGLLLWQLQSPMSRRQRRVGWCLFGVLLTQYVTIRGEAL